MGARSGKKEESGHWGLGQMCLVFDTKIVVGVCVRVCVCGGERCCHAIGDYN